MQGAAWSSHGPPWAAVHLLRSPPTMTTTTTTTLTPTFLLSYPAPADHPRVTKFPHNFDNVPQEQLPTDAEPEPDADDLLPEDDDGEEDDYEDYYEDEEEGGMMDDEVDLQADEGLENRDPNGQQAAGGAWAHLQGKAAGLAAAVADAGAGVGDMEL